MKKEVTLELLTRLLTFDRELRASVSSQSETAAAARIIIGTDEVGRGCLAGPVVAAAVIMPEIDPNSELGFQLALMNDSKQVKEQDRETLAAVLRQHCQFAIGEATVHEIEQRNILNASLLAMRRAIRRLNQTTETIIAVDGNRRIPSLRIEQVTVIDGDTKSASIAAASIIAKVHRDAFMKKLARQFPQYSWESNKGYRSRKHWQALRDHGMTKWHRRTFVEKWLALPPREFKDGTECGTSERTDV